MKRASPVPLWAMLVTLLACGAVLYFIMPDQSSVLDRLVRDGKTRRAYQVWQTVPPEEIARDPAGHELTGLRLQRQLLDRDYDEQLEKLLKRAVAGYRQYSRPAEFAQETQLLIGAARQPFEVLDVVGPALETMRDEDRAGVMRALVKHALEYGQPDVAALAYERCWRHLPHTEENLSEYVRMWRYADEQEKALAVLERFEQDEGKNLFAFSYTLGRLRIDLLRELGRNQEAFDHFHPVVAGAAISPLPSDLQLLRATASGATQQKQLLVQYQRYLQRNTNDLEVWRRAAEIAVYCDEFDIAREGYEKLVAIPKPDPADVRSLAQILEWTGHAGKAFDLYLRLAEDGDNAALDRMVELNPGLYRDKDLMRVIHDWHGTRAVGDYHLLLARLLTKHGRYPEAEHYFQAYIKGHPGNVEALEEYAGMLKRQFAYAKAIPLYTELISLNPTNHVWKKSLAQLNYLVGNYTNSLRLYQQLAPSGDLEVLQKLANLGEALGNYPVAADALTRNLQVDPETSDFSYLKLAYIHGLAKAQESQRRTLLEGLKRFPQSESLQLQLAVVLIEQKAPAQALPLLAQHPQLRSNLFVFSLYLNLLVEARDYATAEAFLKTAPPAMLSVPHVVLLRAVVAEGSGDYATAERHYKTLYLSDPEVRSYALGYVNALTRQHKLGEASVVLRKLLSQPTPELLSEAARLYHDMGDLQQAEQFQRQYLERKPDVPFGEWTYLGDICAAAGNRVAARAAYARALAMLQTRTKKP